MKFQTKPCSTLEPKLTLVANSWRSLQTTGRKFPILPAKPSGKLWEDPIASGEWDRIVELLSQRYDLEEVGEMVIFMAAQSYAAVTVIAKQVEITGRHEDVAPMLDDLAEVLDRYRRMCAELGVKPAPIAQLRKI